MTEKTPCPFCDPPDSRVFYRSKLVYGLWDGFPVSEGQALLIPHRHIFSWFEASAEERSALFEGVDYVRNLIDQQHEPVDYNVGINIGSAAGQTIPHFHVHVIPRYPGDVDDPRKGVRHVIPWRGNYEVEKQRANPSIVSSPHDDALVIGESDPLLPHLRVHIDSSLCQVAVEVDIAA